MKVIAKGLELAYAKNPKTLNFVTIVSHSDWNDNHPSTHNEPEYDWASMNQKYDGIVNFVNLPDQNGRRPKAGIHRNDSIRGFNSKGKDELIWMKDDPNPAIRWTYERYSIKAKKGHPFYDYSDAGLAYYLVTGNKYANADDLKDYICTEHSKKN